MVKFYFNGTPNPMKVALFLEEAGLPYEAIPVDTRRGHQFEEAFLKLNPNGKVPVIVDEHAAATVFDSTAILLYLAEKTGLFLAQNTLEGRAELLSWLMFIGTGVGPFAGQAVHFKHFAPEEVPYAQKRYLYEAERHFKVLDDRLKNRRHLVSYMYTIADMSLWGWSRMVPFLFGEDGWQKFPYLKRHHDDIGARPAAARALALRESYPFTAEMDDEARGHMFKHLTS